VSEAEIEAALSASRYNLSVAAEMLRISRPSLYMLLEDNPRFRAPGDVPADEIARAHEACGGDLDRMVPMLRISEAALRRRLRELGFDGRDGGDASKRSRGGRAEGR
jgi:two-component system nitrogen regulation response regulator GlnG